MKRDRKRRFDPGRLIHVYRKTADNGLLFYDEDDYIVFFTGMCVYARRHNVDLIAVCLMPDHIHELVSAGRVEDLSAYERDYAAFYAKEMKSCYGTGGQVLRHRFGSAPKKTEKKCRSAIAYVYNNPVEKYMCRRALEYRWNFLAYSLHDSPFSCRPEGRSIALKMAVSLVQRRHEQGKPVNYHMLGKLERLLNTRDHEWMRDMIIRTYSEIRYDVSVRYFGTMDKMITAIDANTGGEWEMKEEFNESTFKPFQDMCRIWKTEIGGRPGQTALDGNSLRKIVKKMVKTGARNSHIARFLHMPLKTIDGILGPDYLRFGR